MMFQYKVLKFLPIKSIATIYIRKSENSLLLDFIFIQHKFIYTTHPSSFFILNSATLLSIKLFKYLSNKKLPRILPCRRIHLS